jgi:hypothetical protein
LSNSRGGDGGSMACFYMLMDLIDDLIFVTAGADKVVIRGDSIDDEDI